MILIVKKSIWLESKHIVRSDRYLVFLLQKWYFQNPGKNPPPSPQKNAQNTIFSFAIWHLTPTQKSSKELLSGNLAHKCIISLLSIEQQYAHSVQLGQFPPHCQTELCMVEFTLIFKYLNWICQKLYFFGMSEYCDYD